MIDYAELTYRVDAMQLGDIAQVMEIEHIAFSAPWSATAYERELVYNENAHFFVARAQTASVWQTKANASANGWLKQLLRLGAPSSNHHQDFVIGYGGFWIMVGEAHIMTIAVRPEYRGRNIGELLLATMVERATGLGASVVTLEVRVSNEGAQTLYRKYGFLEAGQRVRYYSDNDEDALIMTTSPLRSLLYQRQFEILRDALRKKLARR